MEWPWELTPAVASALPNSFGPLGVWFVGISGVFFLALASERFRRFLLARLMERSREPQLWIVAIWIALLILTVVALKQGLYSNDMAAWVQALGSVAAIVAVIVIDQRTADRMRNDRQAEVDQLRREREADNAERREVEAQAVREIRASRLKVMGWAQVTLEEAARQTGDPGKHPDGFTAGILRLVRARGEAIDYMMRLPTEADADLIATLALVQEIHGDAMARIKGMVRGGWYDTEWRAAQSKALADYARAISTAISDHVGQEHHRGAGSKREQRRSGGGAG